MEDKQRVTFNLSAAAATALQELVDMTGETQTGMLNNALVAYAYMRRKANQGTLRMVEEDTVHGRREVEIAFL